MLSTVKVAHNLPKLKTSVVFFRTFRERLLSGFSWNLLSTIALQGSVLLSSIVVARLLGITSFGAFAVLTGTATTIAAVAQGGSGLIATKFVGEHLAGDPVRVANVLRLCRFFTLTTGTFAAIGVFVFAEAIAAGALGRPELESMVGIVGFAIFFQVSASYQFGALQGFGAFKELSLGGGVAGLAHIVFTAVGALTGSAEGALAGFALASALRMGVFSVLLDRVRSNHGVPDHARLDRTDLRMVWRFALPAALAGFVTMPCLWLVTVLVARLPNGLELVGILSVANQVRLVVLQLPSLLNAVSFSVLSRLKGENEMSDFRSVFWSNLCLNQAFALLVVGTLLAFAEPVLNLYGSDFSSGRWVLVLLLISVLPELLAASFYQLIQSAGRMWHSLFLIAIPRDFSYLALTALLVTSQGVIAAASAYLVAQVLGLCATLLIIRLFAAQAIWPKQTYDRLT